MDNKQLVAVYRAAGDYTNKHEYVRCIRRAMGTDSPAAEELHKVFDLAHMTSAEIRKKAGITQRELAEICLISYRAVARWETKSPDNHVEMPDSQKVLAGLMLGMIDQPESKTK